MNTERQYVPWTCSNCGKTGNAMERFDVLCTCGTVTRSGMAARTERYDHDDLSGKPCIHFGDTDAHVLQVHRDAGLGLRVTATMMDPIFGAFPCQVDVDLTPDQVNQLMSYLKETS